MVALVGVAAASDSAVPAAAFLGHMVVDKQRKNDDHTLGRPVVAIEQMPRSEPA